MSDYSDLTALFINTTLKSTSQGESHTERLMRNSMAIMEKAGVGVSMIRAADHAIAFGIYPDMREHGADHDDWPDHIWPKVSEADILVIGTPLWLGRRILDLPGDHRAALRAFGPTEREGPRHFLRQDRWLHYHRQ
jgi:hypothetical protein